MIQHSNPDFWIDVDPGVHRIAAKMVIHSLVSVSYFAEFHEKHLVTLRNANKSPKMTYSVMLWEVLR